MSPLVVAEPEPEEEIAPSNAPGERRLPVRILIVEDDYLVGMELEAGLGDAGYEIVAIVTTAEEAVAVAERERPLLAIMDIRLASARDGIDAAIEIYSRFQIRSIFASAHGDPEVRARAEAARPLGWVAKPYRVETLIREVERALGN
jgi:DNA-binding NarL/FixJ family response regulator